MDHRDRYRRRRKNYLPWLGTPEELEAEQDDWQAFLAEECDLDLGEDVYISPDAVVSPPIEGIGDRTMVASEAIVRNGVELGADCSVNAFASVAGDVTAGDGVRIASFASVWGFDHGFESTDDPIHEQPSTSEGVEIGDDVWIGANATVLDGVTVGPHSVVGAGAVVTDDVPAYAVVAGNPADTVRDRRDGDARAAAGSTGTDATAGGELAGRLEAFGDRAREQHRALLEHYRAEEGFGGYLDQPGTDRTVRALCDAVEIAGLFDSLPPGTERAALVERLQDLQDPETGLIPDPETPPDPDADPRLLPSSWQPYHILSVGYALEVLDASFEHRIAAVDDLSPAELYDKLETLPWETRAWSGGSWIDAYATGLYHNLRYFDGDRSPASLFGWLQVNVDPDTGLWGEPTPAEDWKQPVNGFYRLTRGSYAQFGVDVPYPKAAIDTVLRHGRDPAFFRPSALNACNVLDVIHPLWLCGRQTGYRREEAQEWARERIRDVLDNWYDERGFAFDLVGGEPSLMGTEMWLAILYLLADVCGVSDALGYEPQGVHRTEVPLDIYRS